MDPPLLTGLASVAQLADYLAPLAWGAVRGGPNGNVVRFILPFKHSDGAIGLSHGRGEVIKDAVMRDNHEYLKIIN